MENKKPEDMTREELIRTIKFYQKYSHDNTEMLTRHITMNHNLLRVLHKHGITEYGEDITAPLIRD